MDLKCVNQPLNTFASNTNTPNYNISNWQKTALFALGIAISILLAGFGIYCLSKKRFLPTVPSYLCIGAGYSLFISALFFDICKSRQNNKFKNSFSFNYPANNSPKPTMNPLKKPEKPVPSEKELRKDLLGDAAHHKHLITTADNENTLIEVMALQALTHEEVFQMIDEVEYYIQIIRNEIIKLRTQLGFVANSISRTPSIPPTSVHSIIEECKKEGENSAKSQSNKMQSDSLFEELLQASDNANMLTEKLIDYYNVRNDLYSKLAQERIKLIALL